MRKTKKAIGFPLYGCVLIALPLGSIFTYSGTKHESIKEVMKDAVLHETNKISFLGIIDVNPAFISAVTVTVMLLLVVLCIRIFAIPRFKYVSGKFQLLLEQWVVFLMGFPSQTVRTGTIFGCLSFWGRQLYIRWYSI